MRTPRPSSLIAGVAFLALGCFAAGCSEDTPTSPTTPVATTTDVFTGTLAVGETKYHLFTVVASGDAVATLASVTTVAGQALQSAITIGVGQPGDGVCSVTSSISARPSLAGQLTLSVSPGTYCVNAADTGGIAAPVYYTIRVVHP